MLDKSSRTPERNCFQRGFMTKGPRTGENLSARFGTKRYPVHRRCNREGERRRKPELNQRKQQQIGRSICGHRKGKRWRRPACVPIVVTLYQGGAYHLYRYKKYTDVGGLSTEETQIAALVVMAITSSSRVMVLDIDFPALTRQ